MKNACASGCLAAAARVVVRRAERAQQQHSAESRDAVALITVPDPPSPGLKGIVVIMALAEPGTQRDSAVSLSVCVGDGEENQTVGPRVRESWRGFIQYRHAQTYS
jgi:hypothetical protein